MDKIFYSTVPLVFYFYFIFFLPEIPVSFSFNKEPGTSDTLVVDVHAHFL